MATHTRHVFMFYINKPFLLITTSTLIIRSIIALSRRNWIFLWISIEINILRFIPIITNSKTNQETEAAIKYFIAQALGSRIILMSRIIQWSRSPINYLNYLLIASILLKLGIAPIHFWFPPVITSLSWISCIILATWQKLAPLIILRFFIQISMSFTLIISSINALLGGIIGINQSHLRTIIAYSSITHIGWITRILYIKAPLITLSYYTMYCLITIPLFIIINTLRQINNKQFNKINIISPILQLLLPIMLLSLSGMPPLTGFIPKWLTIYSMSFDTPITLILLILGAIINIYFYINILFNSLLSINFHNTLFTLTSSSPKLTTIIATISLFILPLFAI